MAGKYKVPRGTYDILPSESYKWQFITQKFREVARLFNYREIVTPMFERSGLFERSVGDSSDIVQKEMYKFEDKKGRQFALRPEGTAPVVRSYIENSLQMKPNASKLYYIAPMFRYDRPQKGRYRQFYQYGIENIGSQNPAYDAEVIAMGYIFLEKLGLQNFSLEINSIGCSNCSKDYDKALIEYFSQFEAKLCNDCRDRLQKNPKRVLDCKVPSCQRIAKEAPSMLDYLDEDCQEHFKKVQKYLQEMNIPFTVNPKIVRGLDYYTQTAFEFLNNNLGAQNAVCGGGRYNGLFQQLGGKNMPAIGFAGGMERLILSMENEGLNFGEEPHPQAFIVAMGNEAKQFSLKLVNELRASNIAAETSYEKKSLKAQMKAADKTNSDFSLILGDEELNSQTVTMKNMKTGEQKQIPLATIAQVIEQEITV
jgi:histidyl-tRNA synthetase